MKHLKSLIGQQRFVLPPTCPAEIQKPSEVCTFPADLEPYDIRMLVANNNSTTFGILADKEASSESH